MSQPLGQDRMNTLVTIPFSHFCEKARWALDLGLRHGADFPPYQEEGHLPLFSRRAAKKFGGRQVPVLATERENLRDSTDILAWVDQRLPDGHKLYPSDPEHRAEVLAQEEEFDRRLGPDVRRVAYFNLMEDKAALTAFFEISQVPLMEKRVLRLAPLRAGLVALMRKGLGLTAEKSARSTTRIFATLDDVARRLDRAPYLSGESFGAADLTFAALAGPMLMPPEHPMGWPSLDTLPTSLTDLVARVADTTAGRHVRTCYSKHR